jgi:hypothetical protein
VTPGPLPIMLKQVPRQPEKPPCGVDQALGT